MLLVKFISRIGESFLRVPGASTEGTSADSNSQSDEADPTLERDRPPDTESTVSTELVALCRVLLSAPLWSETTNEIIMQYVNRIYKGTMASRIIEHCFV